MKWNKSIVVSMMSAVLMLGGAHSQSAELPCGDNYLDPETDIVVRDAIFETYSWESERQVEFLRMIGIGLGRFTSTHVINSRAGTIYRCSELCGGGLPVIRGMSLFLSGLDSAVCLAFGIDSQLPGSSFCTITGPATSGATATCEGEGTYVPPMDP